ncbi:MAG: PQQ-like beta-propeller repeat protein, partial [Chloroflexi bacterium]|nr:PQQ-like beta-propeller repeat protein [Chloroflexota bacterium]
MNKFSDDGSMHYFQALNRYIAGMERGDLEAVAVVLREAEDDARLEQMLLDINVVYQVNDHTRPQASEIVEARGILQETVRSHFAAADVYSTSESQQVIMNELMPVEAPPTNHLPPRIQRMSVFVLTLAAILVVVIISASFIAFQATRRAQFVSSPPVHEDQTAAAITGHGTITTFNAMTGAVLWKYETHQNIINDETGLVIKDKVLYALDNGHVYALHLADGSPIWQYSVPLIPPTYLAGNGKRFILDQGIIYVAEVASDPKEGPGLIKTLYGDLYAIRASDGKLLWHYHS